MTSTTFSSAADSVSGGVKVSRRTPRWATDGAAGVALLVLALLGLLIGYARPASFAVGVDGRYSVPYLSGFHDPEAAAGQQTPSYRWTTDRSTILAPDLGRGLWQTTLRLSSPQTQEPPKRVGVTIDERSWTIQLQPQMRDYHLLTPSSGNLSITLDAPARTYDADPRELGVVFGGAAFDPAAVMALPPWWALFCTALTLLLAWLTLRLIGVPTWLAMIGPVAGLALLVWALATNRAPIGLMLPRLLILAVAGLICTLLLILAWRWLARLGRLEPEPWLLPALLVIFYAGFWIKSAGLLYPYSRAIDIDWHVRDIMLVVQGRFRDFYLPSFFSYGKMPVAEWGANPPLLPYTPFFHIVAASFAVLPWPMAHSINVFSIFFDVNRVLLIAALALAFGLRSRGALLAALLYAVTPFTFMLHSWGNIPTTFGIWWALLAIVVLALSYGRWHEPRIFALLTAVLLASFLFYFVMAVFTGFFVIVLALLFALWRGRARRQIGALLGSAALALGLSIAVYYIFFIPEMIERTLPYITSTVAGGQVNEGQAEHISIGTYLANHYDHMGYLSYPVRHGVWVPTLLAIPGLWLLRRNRLALLIIGAWLIVALLFFVVGLRVSMVDKYIFYAAPALAICTAALLERWWPRGRIAQLAIAAIYALTFVSALDIWIERLQRV